MPLTSEPQARTSLDPCGNVDGLGILVPEILLPQAGSDLPRWAVVACDQFTSEPSYWRELDGFVGKAPSTLRMVLPETLLDGTSEAGLSARIGEISRTMQDYLDSGILRSAGRCLVLVERRTAFHPSRWGLVLAVDLDRYDFSPGFRGLVRATEGTVVSRIPPRVAIRRDAPLEVPHVQLLFDDPARSVFAPLVALAESDSLDRLYDFDLSMGGGHVRGFRIDAASKDLRDALVAFSRLPSLKRDGLLFAVGDGNHSLAAAKTHWQEVRDALPAGSDTSSHPARYALAEALDLNDPGLEFEPIHRILFGATLPSVRDFALEEYAALGARSRDFASAEQAVLFARGCDPATHPLPLVSRGLGSVLRFERPRRSLAVATAQDLVDAYASAFPCRVDYIHGEDVVLRLSGSEGCGMLLPALPKSSLFPCIADEGVLPRKAFSMGEASEKRYYLESRRIR